MTGHIHYNYPWFYWIPICVFIGIQQNHKYVNSHCDQNKRQSQSDQSATHWSDIWTFYRTWSNWLAPDESRIGVTMAVEDANAKLLTLLSLLMMLRKALTTGWGQLTSWQQLFYVCDLVSWSKLSVNFFQDRVPAWLLSASGSGNLTSLFLGCLGSYFGKSTLILRTVVPLAMFCFLYILWLSTTITPNYLTHV